MATQRIKYPRTRHLPFSQGATADDVRLVNTTCFNGKNVVVTEKLDGENTTMTRDYIHARSLDSADHPSRHWVKSIWSTIKHELPEGWRVCGENVFAQHSVSYEGLASYFFVFSIWNEKNECLSWEDTVEWCQLLGLEHVPVLFSGPWSKALEENLKTFSEDDLAIRDGKREGFVVRNAAGFHYNEFSSNLAKWVRKGHVQEDSEHWMNKSVVPNKLK